VKVLVVGGTRFVGRHIVRALIDRGHDVTLLHRSATDLFPSAEHLLGDRDGDLAVLAGRTFDATVDACAYFPRQVRHLLDVLGEGAGRYVLISSQSVYDEPAAPWYDESSRLFEPASDDVDAVDDETYGPLKVACEQAATERCGDRALLIRPTYVVGPWDYTQRFTYWVRRLSEGGEVLGPGDADDPVQVIDARDLAAFVALAIEKGLSGPYSLVGPESLQTFRAMLDDVAVAVAPSGTRITWVDRDWLLAQGEDDTTVPLWRASEHPWTSTSDPGRALADGLRLRSVRQSAAEILDHLRAGPTSGQDRGLTRAREAELLAAWHAQHPGA
jgi:2'-hydroxyisoflavone reductase